MSRFARRASPLLLGFVAILLLEGLAPVPAYGASAWIPVGPGAHWSSHRSVIIHPGSPGAIWASLGWGGLYASDDRGRSWRWAGRPFIDLHLGTAAVAAVAADLTRPGALWAATATAVFHTEDGGLRWTQASDESYAAALGGESPFTVAAVPGCLYVGSSKRLLASRDGGRSWEVLYDAGDRGWIEALAVHPARPRKIYVGRYAGGPFLVRSDDSGRTWRRELAAPAPEAWIQRLELTPNGLYLSTSGSDRNLYRSTDGGSSWQQLLAGRAGAPDSAAAWAVDPRRPGTLFLAGYASADDGRRSALWVSRDAGAGWRRIGPAPPAYGGQLLIDSAAGVLYSSDEDRLARSFDGGATWTVVFHAPGSESSCAQVGFRPGHPSEMTLTVGFVTYRSGDGGRSWALLADAGRTSPLYRVRDVEIDEHDPRHMIATGLGAYLTSDGGRTWRQTAYYLDYPEMLVRADRDTLFVYGCGVYRSEDNGESWRATLPCDTWPWAEALRWSQKLELDPSAPTQVYVLTFQVKNLEQPHGLLADYPSILWKSADGGRTWRKIAQNFRTFALDRTGSRLYAVRNRDVLASDDGGKSWRAEARTPYLIHDLLVDPVDPAVFYAAGRGVLRSTDRGATWEPLGEEVPAAALILHPDGKTLYAAGRWGVHKIRLSTPP